MIFLRIKNVIPGSLMVSRQSKNSIIKPGLGGEKISKRSRPIIRFGNSSIFFSMAESS